jgi:class 3 adenylate cyclase
MRCGWRWPSTIGCCVMRLRRTAVGCSSTPVTGSVPHSPRPGGAVDAAVDAQRALELPVRMGIATGEAELREGDYFGAVLNRAARVMAAGHGGRSMFSIA